VNKTKTTSIFGLTAILAISLCAQGCVGVVTWGMKNQTFEPAMVLRKPSVDAVSRAPGGNTENPSALWLEAHWGQPSHTNQVTGPQQFELWTYNFGRRWCGIMPCIIVPIPLVLPVGRERVVFYIRDGRVTHAEVTKLGGYQIVAGLGPEGPFADSGPWH
jgi:hypothetical protein